jgi:leucyl-tRNA synthetase
MGEINFAAIEKKWQNRWEKEKVFEVKDSGKKPYYVLEMFSYPSGEGLHMGHAFNFVIGDVFARFKIMNGFNVLHPVGYDSLGLPAENAAIEAGTHPKDYTNKSIPNFMKQQKGLGLSYDWSRVLSTAYSSYYKWDQWIFLKMLEKGLAYQKESAVNWCSKCNTVLANEQVKDGRCWRHGDVEVEVRNLKQWFLKTTEYADELYENLDGMNWPEKTKAMQKNWIGKSHGTEIDFEINGERWPIFTTRPDTIYGVTFMVVAAQHPKLDLLVTKEQRGEVDEFLKKIGGVSQKSMKDLDELNKEGVFTGSYAVNPATNEKIPIWIANFVIADYGSGMVMADAHDQRDLEFAQKYGINLVETILPESGESSNPNKAKRAFVDYGVLVNSGKFSGLKTKEAIVKITDWMIKEKKGRRITNFKLRDWGISRQRYWGTPIPVVHCEKCGVVPVAEKDLPVELPKDVKFGDGNPLESVEEWLKVDCPKCGGSGRRESDTMDTFVNSSWYMMRFCDPNNGRKIFDVDKVKYWCPVDFYVGGAEHACMHLIYSRFYTKFLRDIGLVDFDEPALRLFHQGMINDEKGEKMSKSKGNVVEPLETMAKYGVDTTRYFLLSMASPDKGFNWSDKEIAGAQRFVKRVFEFYGRCEVKDMGDGFEDSAEVLSRLNVAIRDVGEDIENVRMRAATIKLKELFNYLDKEEGVSKDSRIKALKLLAPFCPHIAEEMFEKMGGSGFVSVAKWPRFDSSKVKAVESGKFEVGSLNNRIIESVRKVVEKYPDKDGVYVYVVPFELEGVDVGKVSEGVGKDVKVFSVGDVEKYDPENKARKARPGMAAVYVE